MAIEIERKFLVADRHVLHGREGLFYRQGYLYSSAQKTLRVRTAGERAYLTVKGATDGISRAEYEYPIPLIDAAQMLDELCEKPLIEKIRYLIDYRGARWEVDEFLAENRGLVLAEIELDHAEQALELPPWLGEEVSKDARYFNANLAKNPYIYWSKTR